MIHTAANGERGATRVVSSGLGLGHYLPALAIRHELRMMGIEAGVDVYEEHLDPARRMRIDATKHAYRNNPRLAMVGERLSGSLAPELDHAPLASVVACWESERVERLIVLSGYWWQAVELYWRKCWPRRCDIQWCHIDAADSPSWKTVPEDNHGRHVWPASAARGEVTARIRMSRQTVMPFRDRSRRFLVHGGGWGLGAYREAAADLLSSGYEVDVVVSDAADTITSADGARFFQDDPDWRPWSRDTSGRFGFPPVSQIGPGIVPRYTPMTDCSGSFQRINESLAVVSKPGGATLWDALTSCVAVIFLPAHGPHEERNAGLWCDLGWGLRYDQWRKDGFPLEPLEKIHAALLAAVERLPVYPRILASE